jgi:hypothetical protein
MPRRSDTYTRKAKYRRIKLNKLRRDSAAGRRQKRGSSNGND